MDTSSAFLSHASTDNVIARELKTALKQEVGLSCFMLPEDAPFGSGWLAGIQKGLKNCEMLFSLLTPKALGRPWIAAEWASFALQEHPRPWVALRLGVNREEVWDPMLGNQDVDLTSAKDIEMLLKQLSEQTGISPRDGIRSAAQKLLNDLADAFTKSQKEHLEEAMAALATNSKLGGKDLDSDDIQAVIEAGRLPDALDIFLTHDAADVKRRQFAVALVKNDRFSDALKVCKAIANKSEIKNVAIPVVDRTPENAAPDSEEWTFLGAAFALLKEPQKRVIWERMNERNLQKHLDWNTFTPKED